MSISAVLLHPAWGLAHRVDSVNYLPVFSGTESPEGERGRGAQLPAPRIFLLGSKGTPNGAEEVRPNEHGLGLGSRDKGRDSSSSPP